MKAQIAIISLCALSGCSALRPHSVLIEADHVSHISQHFGPNPTNYGFDSINVGLKWTPTKHTYFEILEGAVLEKKDGEAYGALAGPREVFTAKAGIEIHF